MATPESKVKTKIRQWLAANGYWYCTPIGSQFGSAGVPDFLCCKNGRLVGIEAKAPGQLGRTTDLQKRVHAAITAAGGTAIVVDDASQLEGLLHGLCGL